MGGKSFKKNDSSVGSKKTKSFKQNGTDKAVQREKRTREVITYNAPANKKRRTKFERAKEKPAFDLVARSKSIWATFRSKRLDKEERQKLSQELFGLIEGKLHQLAVKHDAARVVQCALLHGTPPQREVYTTELLPHILEFSKIQYAHFIVLRLLDVTSSNPTERKRILRIFTGRVPNLATHAVGAKVLEGIFSTYPKQETQALRCELYGGREVQLFLTEQNVPRDLKALLAGLPADIRREQIFSHMSALIQKMLVKGLAGVPFVQELLWEYVANIGPVGIREMIPNLMDYLLLLTGTRPGCKVLAELAAYGTAKDRKKMLKSLKGYVIPTLFHKDAYLFILRLADVVDDTVTFNKVIWSELLEKDAAEEETVLQLATHVKASKVLLNLLAPTKRSTFLVKDELELLKPALIPQTADALASDVNSQVPGDGKATVVGAQNEKEKKEEEELLVPTSKKDAELRRSELLAPLKEALITVGTRHARELLCSAEGSFVLYEIASRWRGEEMSAALLEAIAKAAATDGGLAEGQEEEEASTNEEAEEETNNTEEEGEEEGEEVYQDPAVTGISQVSVVNEEDLGPLREHRIAYKTIKRLLLYEATTGDKDIKPLFGEALSREIHGEWLKWLSSMRGGFIVEALVKVKEIGPMVLHELETKHIKDLNQLSTNNMKGAAAILGMISSSKNKPVVEDSSKKKKSPKRRS